jgi:hypothetical protein
MREANPLGLRARELLRRLRHPLSAAGTRLTFERTYSPPSPRGKILFLVDADRATFHLYFDQPLRFLEPDSYEYAVLTHAGCATLAKQLGTRRLAKLLLAQYQPTRVVFSRFGGTVGLDIIAEARARNIPVIYHLDDDLLHPPETLGPSIAADHGQAAMIENRTAAMEAVDILCPSTPALMAVLRRQFGDRHFIAAPLPPILGQMADTGMAKREGGAVIGYMGSRGHQRDLELVRPALAQLLDEYPALRFETFGTVNVPTSLEDAFPGRTRSWPVLTDYQAFRKTLFELGWTIGLAPLIDDPFNRCRTPVKFVEYTSCRIPVFASNMEVYNLHNGKGALRLVDDNQWYAELKSALEGGVDLDAQVKSAVELAASQFSLKQAAADVDRLLSFEP